ncbi:MAG: hypothetical protein MJK04_23850 [Psychrosphaera sp.]|nr:hypothetical protein [Psychrosphaera sp.]
MNEKWVKSSAAVYAFIFVLILSSVVQAQSMFVAGQQVSQLTEAQKQQLLNQLESDGESDDEEMKMMI